MGLIVPLHPLLRQTHLLIVQVCTSCVHGRSHRRMRFGLNTCVRSSSPLDLFPRKPQWLLDRYSGLADSVRFELTGSFHHLPVSNRTPLATQPTIHNLQETCGFSPLTIPLSRQALPQGIRCPTSVCSFHNEDRLLT